MELLTALKVIDGYGLTVTKGRNATIVAAIRDGGRDPATRKKTSRNGRVPITTVMLEQADRMRGRGKSWVECQRATGAGSANGLQAAHIRWQVALKAEAVKA